MGKALIQKCFQQVTNSAFTVTYWDETTETYGQGQSLFQLVFHQPVSAVLMAEDPMLALGEAYMDGHLDLVGNHRDIIRALHLNKEFLGHKRNNGVAGMLLKGLSKAATLHKQEQDIRYHYDLGNNFYALWLDPTLSYSCAYFQSAKDSLHQAQLQKIDHVLKKLQLKPGETLLDIGSGWGWLLVKAAQQYGVKATGITLSKEQVAESRRRIAEYGLAGQINVELLDYRVLAEQGHTFDKIVSIGMFEHVGQDNYPTFMQTVHKLLQPEGLALLHTITQMTEDPVNTWITKYIFPGGYIPSLRETIWLLPESDFHVIDVESLRRHYAITLEHWLAAFEQHVEAIKAMYDERFVRMWRLYLMSSAASFRIGTIDVHQILFSKGINDNLPLTRDYLSAKTGKA
ncbi:MAG: cyclopropane-fatty-acyl-phospholipid synthase [Heliobacteriaceae bacterium]|nr:cyclopropane-fatty-acyl-phospholipid synthase [Heliobacteriaceae bacterium]